MKRRKFNKKNKDRVRTKTHNKTSKFKKHNKLKN